MDKDGWRPIETAPRDGTDVVIYAPNCGVLVAYWSDSIWASVNNPVRGQGGGWVQEVHRSDTCVFSPTHWMPLPEPPKDEDAADSTADSPLHNSGDKHASA